MAPPPLLDFLHRWTDTQIQHNKNNNKKEKITTLITTPIKARRGEPRRETRGEVKDWIKEPIRMFFCIRVPSRRGHVTQSAEFRREACVPRHKISSRRRVSRDRRLSCEIMAAASGAQHRSVKSPVLITMLKPPSLPTVNHIS